MISKNLRKQLKKHKFELNIFETTVYFISEKDVFQLIYDDIKHNDRTDEVNGICLSTTDKGVKDVYIGMFCDRDDVLVHECTHASLYILDNIEESINCNSELQPYLIQTLFRECKKILKVME